MSAAGSINNDKSLTSVPPIRKPLCAKSLIAG